MKSHWKADILTSPGEKSENVTVETEVSKESRCAVHLKIRKLKRNYGNQQKEMVLGTVLKYILGHICAKDIENGFVLGLQQLSGRENERLPVRISSTYGI